MKALLSVAFTLLVATTALVGCKSEPTDQVSEVTGKALADGGRVYACSVKYMGHTQKFEMTIKDRKITLDAKERLPYLDLAADGYLYFERNDAGHLVKDDSVAVFRTLAETESDSGAKSVAHHILVPKTMFTGRVATKKEYPIRVWTVERGYTGYAGAGYGKYRFENDVEIVCR